MGMMPLWDRDAVPDWGKLYFSGRLASLPRNAEGLESIIKEFFEVDAEVVSFVGHWLSLPEDSVCRLGHSPETGTLGELVALGSRVWDRQLKFRIRLGPMPLRDFERLLPQTSGFARLKAWVLDYVGEELFWDVAFVLKAEEVPGTTLGHHGALGWTTWLKTKPFAKDSEDLVVDAG